ncbi:MAG: hypothetical protein Q4B05_02830 [Candidatus Saccharibacteria bacterium]|nr:hypothetical protein [Candidatus Saccharibacteria bacterium]
MDSTINHNKLPSKESESPLQIAEKLWGMVSSDKYSPKPIEELRHPDLAGRVIVESYGLSSDDLSGIRMLDGLRSPFMQEAPDGTRRIGWCHLHIGGPMNNPNKYIDFATLTYDPNNPEDGTLRLRTIMQGNGEKGNEDYDTIHQYSLTGDHEGYVKALRRLEHWIEAPLIMSKRRSEGGRKRPQ